MILALFAGIGDLFLALTFKKPKENQCFSCGSSASEFREALKHCVFTVFGALFAGIADLFLALTIKKLKENQCFWFRTLKNLRKIKVFGFEP